MREVSDHPEHSEQIGVAGHGSGGDEVPQGSRIGGVDALIRVERHDPARLELSSRGEKAVAVGGIVPALVARTTTVLKSDSDKRTACEQLARGVGAAVVES